ncbi:MAG: hypothetical protein F4X26_03165 [Chloroflexi bacterium]|nr:hypothetical protein [Chloroflexota bacterium]
MVVVKRALAVLFVLVGGGLAAHFVLDPVLYDWEGGQPALWHVFDWARAVSLPLAVIATFEAKRRADAGADARGYIAANVQFYLAAALTLLFYWNWVQVGWAAGEQQPDSQVWVFIDVVLPVVFVPLGLRLWREAEG